jgi:hypothetical protein
MPVWELGKQVCMICQNSRGCFPMLNGSTEQQCWSNYEYIAYKISKRLNVLDSSWFRPVLHDFDFARIHLKSVGSDHMTKIINRFQVEITFLAICIQTMLSELFKDFGDVLKMIIFKIKISSR